MVLHGLALLAVGAMLVTYVPKHEKMFMDMRLTLPQLTSLIIHISNLVKTHWYVLFTAVLAADGAVFYTLRTRAGSKTPSLVWSGLVLAVLVLFAGIIYAAMRLPLLDLMAQLSRQR